MVKAQTVATLGTTYTKGYKPDVSDRWLVLRLAGVKKMSNLDIRTFTGLGIKFIEHWAAKGRAGCQDVGDAPRPGRPHAISPKSQKRLKTKLRAKRFVTPARLALEFGCTARTIRNTAHDLLKLKPFKVQWRCRQTQQSMEKLVSFVPCRLLGRRCCWLLVAAR
jgi:transposase